ncbi:hypothetical protein [Ornithinibacillus bavariensis]|uniref:Uncharacterized protein n=1 Tax=Ornithinibacillus bavariensis TaxID=545502 RepID=A0A919X9J1_9BACI|nr:hypothetical protein [Ornithinibacillus bavariensis]GIO27000.1 hypothetical protein J43TS3_16110 [Ornithinibacillus bavariensis]
MANDENKAPFYKRWWFWLIVVIVLLIIIFSAGRNDEDNKDTTNTGTEETTNDTNNKTKDNNRTNEDNDTTKEESAAAKRDNSSAKETTLNAGKFTVGTDIPAGRYVITGEGTGNLFVYDEDGLPVVNEILDKSADMGVPNVTTDIKDGQEIEISGLNAVTFTPAKTKLSNKLTTGTWIVGLDIKAGRYNVTTPSGSGNFFIYNNLGVPTTNEILDATGEMGVKQITVTLEDGQQIGISGLNEVDFTKK